MFITAAAFWGHGRGSRAAVNIQQMNETAQLLGGSPPQVWLDMGPARHIMLIKVMGQQLEDPGADIWGLHPLGP